MLNKKLEEILESKNSQNKKMIEDIVTKMRMYNTAFLKANFYSTIASILFNKSMETGGYLINPSSREDLVTTDIYLSAEQNVTADNYKVNGEKDSEGNREIKILNYKPISGWHSHGKKYNPFHSDKDDKNFDILLNNSFVENKVKMNRFKSISIEHDDYRFEHQKKDNNDFILLKSNKSNVRDFRLKVNKIDQKIIDLLNKNGVVIEDIQKEDPLYVAYSLVTDSNNAQPYVEIAYKEGYGSELKFKKGKDVKLEIIDNGDLSFDDYKKLVNDISTKVYHNGELPKRKISNDELKKIISSFKKRVDKIERTVIPMSSEDKVEIIHKEPKLESKISESYKNKENNIEDKKTDEEKVVEAEKLESQKTPKQPSIMNNNKTIDAIVVNEPTEKKRSEVFRYGRKLNYDEREKVFDLYNNHYGDIKVKEICGKLNEGKDQDNKKTFSVSTLYNILKEYQQNGRRVEWRKNKVKNRKQNKTKKYKQLELLPKKEYVIKDKGTIDNVIREESDSKKNIIEKNQKWYKTSQNYITGIVEKSYKKTKNFIRRNIKSIISYSLVVALSFFLGYEVRRNIEKKNIDDYVQLPIEVGQNTETKTILNDKPELAKTNQNSAKEIEGYVLPHNELNLLSDEKTRISYIPEEPFIKNNVKDYFVKKGDTLWEIMSKETGRPELWEILYASQESYGKTTQEKLRQHRIREFADKYSINSLKNAGNEGTFEPYKLGLQRKIMDGTHFTFNKDIIQDISKITPEIESEFNTIFYGAST